VSLIDISVTLRANTPEWPGDTPFSCRWAWEIAKGESVNVSVLSGSPHVGTHADAPLHVRNDAPGASELPLTAFVGLARVVDVAAATGVIDVAALGTVRHEAPRLLLKTGRSITRGVFPSDWPVLSVACVQDLLAAGLLLLGVDAPSVDERESRTLPVHHALFDGGAHILENLDLTLVAPGTYRLYAAPIKIEGSDAAPVRAFLEPLSGT
jgi:arylformamidase